MNAVVGQDGLDVVGYGLDQCAQKVVGDTGRRLIVQLDESELRCSVDRDEEMQLAVRRPHLDDISLKVADRVGFECLTRGLIPNDFGRYYGAAKGRDAAKSASDAGSSPAGRKAIVQGQKLMPPGGSGNCLSLNRKHLGLRFFRSSRYFGNRGPRLLFGDGLPVEPVALCQSPQALMTMLCSTASVVSAEP